MVKLYIPQVGEKLKLTENWDCKVFNEHRNSKVFSGLNIDTKNLSNVDIDITFPKGTVLRVDRLYVRAPASSYDSITFTIESSPIKTLSKARFWVKLMSANTIEYEEIKNDMDSQEKLKNLYRYVALKNEYKNSENLNIKESSMVSKEIYEHYLKKDNKELEFKFNITAKELFDSINHQHFRWGWNNNNNSEQNEYVKKTSQECYEMIDNYSGEMVVKMIPVLDGWVYFISKVESAFKYNEKHDLLGKYDKRYYREDKLGSNLESDRYICEMNKKNIQNYIVNRINDFSLMKIKYQGNEIEFENEKEFNKFLKSIRK